MLVNCGGIVLMHKKRMYTLLIAIIILFSVIGTINIIDNQYVSTFNLDNSSNFEKHIDGVVKKYLESEKFSGTVLLAKNNKIIFNEGYGYSKRYFGRTKNRSNTKYLIGSISKVFTATAILKLADDGVLRLEDQINKYFPDYTRWNGITIHHLLNNSSGIKNYYDSAFDYMRYFTGSKSPNEIISRFKDEPLLFEIGTDNYYSNTNYVILTSIIEQVTGMKYIEYVKKEILNPINLTNTGYEENINSIEHIAKGYTLNMLLEVNGMNLSNFYGAGGLYSTTEDLYNFFMSIEKENMLNEKTRSKTKRGYYGYGLTYKEVEDIGNIYYHTGNLPGFSSAVYNLQDQDITIVILANNQTVKKNEMMLDLVKIIKSSNK